MREVSRTAARRLALLRQRLAAPAAAAGPRDGILRTVGALGYVQLDPTNVVARSHLLVLLSRCGPFEPAELDALLWRERSLFEYRALILPTADLPIHALTMAAYRRPRSAWARRVAAWVAANGALRRHVLARLRAEGPLPTSAFEDRARVSWRSTGWSSGKNVSRMLELLSAQGHVVVAGRSGGERLWTLADRWLPRATALATAEAERRGTERALLAMGVATAGQLRNSYAFARFATRRAIAALEREGTFVAARIAGGEPRRAQTWYLHADDVDLVPRLEREWEGRTTLLSPFDNLIIDRARTEMLFGFRYRMEIYVPAERRRFGYFAMPILNGDRLVGTVDPRVDRERARLVVNAVHAELDAPRTRETARAVREAIEELAAFSGAREIVWPRRLPTAWAHDLRAG